MKTKLIYLSLCTIFIFLTYYFFLNDSLKKEVPQKKPNQIDSVEFQQQIPWGTELIGNNSYKKEGKRKIRIAVLDSGINSNHYDLKGKIVQEYNATLDEPEDNFGHGTAIAGIITANDNDIGIVGITQNVELISVKVIDNNGKIDKQDFIKGFEWAITNDVDVINLSLGFQSDFPELRRIIQEALDKGIIIVAASGNTYGLNAQFPARYDDVISVGLVDEFKQPTKYSAIGKIDFVAPGVNILSLKNDGHYSYYNGSSYSTAFITGVISEILSNDTVVKNESIQKEVYKLLKDLSIELDDTNNKVGNGIPTLNNSRGENKNE